MTYDERKKEIIRQLESKSVFHARNELNYLIKDLGYE